MKFNKLNERFAKFAPPLFLSGQDIYSADTVANHLPGTMAFASMGRMFRYALNGASALVVGNLLQEAVEDTSYENMAVTASAIVLPQNGIQIVNVTNGTATITDAQFKGGSLSIYTAGGDVVGQDFDILGVSGTLTTGGALVVTLDRPIGVAWTTALKVVMKRSPWSGVIQAPITTATGMAVGVSTYAIPASTATVLQYGWVQTHGPATILSSNQTFAVGSDLGTPCLDAAGAVSVYAAGTTHQRIGVARMAAATTKGIPIFLQID
jgi:hypothetical protein